MWSIFCEIFYAYCFNSLKQDPLIEFQKKRDNIQFMQFTLEVAILKCFLIKHSQEILGIKYHISLLFLSNNILATFNKMFWDIYYKS
jgi:hypothetical protein